jgi:glycosyltransferase involved in cell wall biosynthesis
MRITIITGPFYPIPPAPTGSVERLWSDLAREFAARGHQVTILACRYDGQAESEIRSDGVHVRRVSSFKQSQRIYIDLLKDLWHCMRLIPHMPPADILVTNSFSAPIVARLRPRTGRIVLCANRAPRGQFWLYDHVPRLQAVSTAVADAIVAERPSSAARVKVIPNPIDANIFRPPERPRWQGPTRSILFTGRVHPDKGVHTLVAAFCSLVTTRPFLRLRIVGPQRVEQGGGGDSYMRQLRELAADRPVEICEPIYDRQKLAAALHEADYYVYPTLAERGEALPVAPLEALATGLAPVVSDIPQFRDYIVPGETGLVYDVHEGDIASNLEAALATIVDDPALAATMGANATRRAQDFSYERVTKMFLEDFAELVNSSSSMGFD